MIDTLILRIHNLDRYRSMIKTLDPQQSKGYTTQTAKVDGEEVRKLRAQGLHTQGEILDILKMNRTGDFLVKTQFAKHQNASNHYTFSWMANYTANYLEFNFSLPKYVYVSNVVMFTDHIGERNFSFGDCWELKPTFKLAADKFGRFIEEFFKMEFPFTNLDFRDVEVNRIDVCFNQMFRTKGDALKYLSYQKRQTKKYARNQEGVMQDWETSLMYKTKRYSAKIYHKGTEYTKNDMREHLKINKEKGWQFFRTEEYQAFADRMLRYELTIRNTELNYLHKKYLFRRRCPHFKPYMEVYRRVENAKQKNDRIAKRIGELPEEEKRAYKKAHPYEKIDSEERKIHKWVANLFSKKTFFKLAVNDEIEEYNKGMVGFECSEARFSRELMMLCFKRLEKFMKEYQIKELPLEDQIEKFVIHYNERNKAKLPRLEMMKFYKDLHRLGSFREVAKFNMMSRATLFRYKDRFKKIGITENNLIPLTEDGIPLAEINLKDYHYEHQANARFLNKQSILNMY